MPADPVYGAGGIPVGQINPGGSVHPLHHDQQGSTRVVTYGNGADAGDVAAKYTYDVHGKTTATSRVTSVTRIGCAAILRGDQASAKT